MPSRRPGGPAAGRRGESDPLSRRCGAAAGRSDAPPRRGKGLRSPGQAMCRRGGDPGRSQVVSLLPRRLLTHPLLRPSRHQSTHTTNKPTRQRHSHLAATHVKGCKYSEGTVWQYSITNTCNVHHVTGQPLLPGLIIYLLHSFSASLSWPTYLETIHEKGYKYWLINHSVTTKTWSTTS